VFRRAECVLVRAGFSLTDIRTAPLGQLESWLRGVLPPSRRTGRDASPDVDVQTKRFVNTRRKPQD
jgi:hypothetical protein